MAQKRYVSISIPEGLAKGVGKNLLCLIIYVVDIMNFSDRSNQIFIISLIMVVGWLFIVSFSSYLDIDKALIKGIEQASLLLIGYLIGIKKFGGEE